MCGTRSDHFHYRADSCNIPESKREVLENDHQEKKDQVCTIGFMCDERWGYIV